MCEYVWRTFEKEAKVMTKTTRYKHQKRDLERFAAKIAAWAKDGKQWAAEGDKEMAQAYQRDVRDLQAVYRAIRRGDYAKASQLAYELDTIVRDQIPVRLYNEINPA